MRCAYYLEMVVVLADLIAGLSDSLIYIQCLLSTNYNNSYMCASHTHQ